MTPTMVGWIVAGNTSMSWWRWAPTTWAIRMILHLPMLLGSLTLVKVLMSKNMDCTRLDWVGRQEIWIWRCTFLLWEELGWLISTEMVLGKMLTFYWAPILHLLCAVLRISILMFLRMFRHFSPTYDNTFVTELLISKCCKIITKSKYGWSVWGAGPM